MSKNICVMATCALVFAATAAAAGTVSVSVKDGRVTIVADNATPREILREWARVGQVRIVNGERVPGQPLTLRLDGVSERKALDIVLRGAAGYMLASREGADGGATYFDRIVILPTSNTAAVAATRPAAQPPTPRRAVQQPDSGMMGFSAAPAAASPEETDPDPAQVMPQAPVINPYGQPATDPSGQPEQNPYAPGQNPYTPGVNPNEQGQAEAVEMQQAPALFPGSPSAPAGVVPDAPAGGPSTIPAAGAVGASRPGEVVQPVAPPIQYLNPYNIGARPAPEQAPARTRPGSSTTTTPRPPDK